MNKGPHIFIFASGPAIMWCDQSWRTHIKCQWKSVDRWTNEWTNLTDEQISPTTVAGSHLPLPHRVSQVGQRSNKFKQILLVTHCVPPAGPGTPKAWPRPLKFFSSNPSISQETWTRQAVKIEQQGTQPSPLCSRITVCTLPTAPHPLCLLSIPRTGHAGFLHPHFTDGEMEAQKQGPLRLSMQPTSSAQSSF